MKFLTTLALVLAVAACGGEEMPDDAGMANESPSGMMSDTGHMMGDSMMSDSMMGDSMMARDSMGATGGM